MLVGLGVDLDVNGTPARSTLHIVNLADRTTDEIVAPGVRNLLATWSADGEWVAVSDNRDVMLIDPSDPTSMRRVADAIAPDHWPLAAG